MLSAMPTNPKTAIVATALAALVTAMPAAAEPAGADHPQPYAGLQTRPIKALSDAQIDDYRYGRGMSLALAAELNGYPGPRHVLDLAGPLGLTAAQIQQAQAAFDSMRNEAIGLGERIVAEEAALDRLFAEAMATPDSVEALTASIAQMTGRLRFTHLRVHLALRDLLTDAQVVAYETLRGYRSTPTHQRHGAGH